MLITLILKLLHIKENNSEWRQYNVDDRQGEDLYENN